jgi:twitching motility protein PilT
MAQLDRFIEAMFKRSARGFELAADAEPVLLEGDKRRQLTSKKPNAKQVRKLLAEIAPNAVRSELAEKGGATFTYEAPPNPAVRVKVKGWNGQTVFRIEPVPQDDDPFGEVGLSLKEDGAIGGEKPPEPPHVDFDDNKGGGGGRALAATMQVTQPSPTKSSGPHKIDKLFRIMVENGASDLHMSAAEIPMLRKDGSLKRIDHKRLSSDELYQLLLPIMPEKNVEEFDSDGDTDFAYEIKGLARFRANMFRDRKGVGAVFRTIPAEILTVDDLGLSQPIRELCKLTKGLVLVTGPTGSGKSTTLCALIDLINRSRDDHILTIEDPIEFVHENKKCLINQREVGVHTQGFKRALRAALREDPDVVLVGEMRDLETIAIAIETAETGHLVFGTLHTSTAYSTVDRIIDQFPPDQQEQIRVMLSESLKGVISQTLCKKIGGGRVAALEVLLGNPAVANLIREGKTFQIPSIMQTNRGKGMVMLNEALVDLVQKKVITTDEALMKAVDKATLRTMFKNANIEVPGATEG